MKLTKEQVMVAHETGAKGRSVRQLSKQLGVGESTLRYRFGKQEAGPTTDGRASQPTALDGYEEAVRTIQERLDDGRLSGEGRPAQPLEIYREAQASPPTGVQRICISAAQGEGRGAQRPPKMLTAVQRMLVRSRT